MLCGARLGLKRREGVCERGEGGRFQGAARGRQDRHDGDDLINQSSVNIQKTMPGYENECICNVRLDGDDDGKFRAGAKSATNVSPTRSKGHSRASTGSLIVDDLLGHL
jgi:hypothetical protein